MLSAREAGERTTEMLGWIKASGMATIKAPMERR